MAGRPDPVDVAALGRAERRAAKQLGQADHRVHGGTELMAHRGEELLPVRVGLAQRLVRPGQLAGAAQDLGAHPGGIFAKLSRQPLVGILPLGELGDIYHLVQDVRELPARVEQRAVTRAPVPHLEPAAFGGGAAHVVMLHRHRVRPELTPDAIKGGGQVGYPRGAQVIRVVREDIKYVAAQNVLPGRHRGRQVRVTDRNDGQPRVEHQVQPWYPFEQPSEIQPGRRFRARGPAVSSHLYHNL